MESEMDYWDTSKVSTGLFICGVCYIFGQLFDDFECYFFLILN